MRFEIDLDSDFALKIGAHEWHVRFVDVEDFSTDSAPWGLCESHKQRITINRSATPSMRLSTLLHEMLHALEAVYEIDISHKDLNLTADALAQILIDSFAAPAKKAKK